ncbi:MAG: DUF4422 domain-containing protein [Lachnospiraceae bacterium]|nr:DUF4422 domain-containing protein [Lachnospiraceae bacterium]
MTERGVALPTKKRIKIWVMTHRKFNEPADPAYVPLHVGKAIGEDLGYIGDDTGDQISAQNIYYGELTGQYWAAENVHDAEYMGICHYRRFFLNRKHQIMSGDEYLELLKDYDILIPEAIRHPQSYYETFAQAHNIQDLDATGRALKELYPDAFPIYQGLVEGNEVHSSNMFVASSELFREYTEWLFSIFRLAEKEIDVSGYDEYHRRVYGFLSEQLNYVWIKWKGLKYCEIPIGITQEKAETVELKKRLAEEVRKGDPNCGGRALGIFREVMGRRPDVMLGASDLSGDLADMFRVLYVLDKEQQEEPAKCMLRITNELDQLILHYRLVTRIISSMNGGNASTEEIDYLRDADISNAMKNQIMNMMEV